MERDLHFFDGISTSSCVNFWHDISAGISVLASELGGILHVYTALGTKFLSLRSCIHALSLNFE